MLLFMIDILSQFRFIIIIIILLSLQYCQLSDKS